MFEEMNKYRERVEEAAVKCDGEMIANSSVEHAQIVIERLFLNANKIVNIFSGSLNIEIYGADNIVRAVKMFVKKPDVTLNIILEEEIDSEHPLSEVLSLGNVRKDVLPKEVAESVECHMITVDEDSYRFEMDKYHPQSMVSWGKKEFTVKLNKLFGELAASCSRKD